MPAIAVLANLMAATTTKSSTTTTIASGGSSGSGYSAAVFITIVGVLIALVSAIASARSAGAAQRSSRLAAQSENMRRIWQVMGSVLEMRTLYSEQWTEWVKVNGPTVPLEVAHGSPEGLARQGLRRQLAAALATFPRDEGGEIPDVDWLASEANHLVWGLARLEAAEQQVRNALERVP